MSRDRTVAPVASPWAGFFLDLDGMLDGAVELHCLGGFVLATLYGLPRPTADVDYFAINPADAAGTLERLAGRESTLARKHRVWVQHVTVADYPDGYGDRLREIGVAGLRHLHLRGLEPNDLVLSKLTRNHPVDLEDARFLIGRGLANASVLRERYQRELRPYLARQETHDLTLDLWLEYFPPGSR